MVEEAREVRRQVTVDVEVRSDLEQVLGVGLAVEVSLLVQRDKWALVAADPPPWLRSLGSERTHALGTRARHPHRKLRLATGTKHT